MKRDQCDEFLCGYLDAALFTTDNEAPGACDYVESGRASEMFPKLPAWFLKQARKDCAAFTVKAEHLLVKAGSPWQNGSDFWYTRNRHGVGFWDRGYDEKLGDELTAISQAFGECDLLPEDIGQKS
jgi:hypothetical protein